MKKNRYKRLSTLLLTFSLASLGLSGWAFAQNQVTPVTNRVLGQADTVPVLVQIPSLPLQAPSAANTTTKPKPVLGRAGATGPVSSQLQFSAASAAAALNTVSLKDVPSNHWAYEAVQLGVGRGLLTGFPDGTFRGTQPVSRYELSLIIARFLNMTVGSASTSSQEAVIDQTSNALVRPQEIQVLRGQVVALGQTVTEQAKTLQEVSAGRSEDSANTKAVRDEVASLREEVAALNLKVKAVQDVATVSSSAEATALLGQSGAALPDNAPVASQPDVTFKARTEVPTGVAMPRLALGISANYGGASLVPGVSLDYRFSETGPLALQPYLNFGMGEVKSTSLGLNLVYNFNTKSDFKPYVLLGGGGTISEGWTSTANVTDYFGRVGVGVEYNMASTLSLFGDVNGNYLATNKGVASGLSESIDKGIAVSARAGIKLRF